MNLFVGTEDKKADNLNLAYFLNGDILRRAGLVALVIGSILTLVNQPDAVFGSAKFKYVLLVLSYLTPFVVVAISQVLGIQKAMMDARQSGDHALANESVLSTALAHGIPLRALVVGMIAGSFNAFIVIAIALSESTSTDSLSTALLAQPFVLVLLFGLLSQTIAYRRTTQTFHLERQRPRLWEHHVAVPFQERNV